MQYDQFMGLVQNRARLASTGEAVRATRATLETLSERLFGGASNNLAAQLPQEVGKYMEDVDKEETFGVDEFFDRVAKREAVDKPDAVHHARAVLSVVQEAVTPAEMVKVLDQLPPEYRPLFDAGSEGELDIG